MTSFLNLRSAVSTAILRQLVIDFSMLLAIVSSILGFNDFRIEGAISCTISGSLKPFLIKSGREKVFLGSDSL